MGVVLSGLSLISTLFTCGHIGKTLTGLQLFVDVYDAHSQYLHVQNEIRLMWSQCYIYSL